MRLTEDEYRARQISRQTPEQRAEREASERAQAVELAEAEIEKEIESILRFHRIPYTLTKAENARGKASKVREGWPDITGLNRGTFLAIEVKAASGKLRKKQVEVLAELWEAGALIIIARSGQDVHDAIRDGKHPASVAELCAAIRKTS